TPDASGEGIHGRATRHAAAKVLSRELAIRSDALVAAPDEAITLSPNGRIVWAGSEIARLERGENALKPRLQLNADEHLALPERERVMKRLDLSLRKQSAHEACLSLSRDTDCDEIEAAGRFERSGRHHRIGQMHCLQAGREFRHASPRC